MDIAITVRGGCVTGVYVKSESKIPIEVEVLDFDGDFLDGNEERFAEIDNDPQWEAVY